MGLFRLFLLPWCCKYRKIQNNNNNNNNNKDSNNNNTVNYTNEIENFFKKA